MCDTLCARFAGGMIFAKSSDRPVAEAQVVEPHAPRRGVGHVRTQYLEIADAGAAATLLARPAWLWGAEHGINAHRVAIGNEKVYTTDDPYAEQPALIGMDLVRLGLERARSADEAVGVMTSLLERHGQGGVADAGAREPYFSSFLVADPQTGWVLETSGRTWAARRVGAAAISNRLTLRADWEVASADVAPGSDFDGWRNKGAPSGFADVRLAASRALLFGSESGEAVAEPAARGIRLSPALVAAHLRDHGNGPWGAPGGAGEARRADPPPDVVLPDGTGVTICMHVRGYQATASSMVAQLPADPEAPLRAWIALGSPCVSVFVPVFPPDATPAALGSEELWWRIARLRDRVEADGEVLAVVRAVLAPVEAELWEEADVVACDAGRRRDFIETAGRRLHDGVARAEAAIGTGAGGLVH